MTAQGSGLKPIAGRGGSGTAVRSWMVWNRLRMFSPCARLSFSNLSSRSARSLWAEIISRNLTNALMMAMFTRMARRLWSTPESMATPSWVNANGSFLRPPQPELDVAICDIKLTDSDRVNLNMKSRGKRLRFLRTCSFNRRVLTEYMAAKSASSMTRRPRIRNIRLPISSTGTKEAWVSILIYTHEPPFWFPGILNVHWRWEGGTFQNVSPLCILDKFRFRILKKPNRPTEIIPDFQEAVR